MSLHCICILVWPAKEQKSIVSVSIVHSLLVQNESGNSAK